MMWPIFPLSLYPIGGKPENAGEESDAKVIYVYIEGQGLKEN